MNQLFFKITEDNDDVTYLEYVLGEVSGNVQIIQTTESAVTTSVNASKGTLYNSQDALEAAIAYVRPRKLAYPSVVEQLDMLYHDMAGDKGDKTGDWFAAIKAAKDANAKG